MITWSRLRDGNWGLRSTEALTEGEVVLVSRANGSRSKAAVGRKVWAGNGVFLYAKGQEAPKAEVKVALEPLVLDWSVAEALDGEDAEMAAEIAAERAANCAEAGFYF